MSISARAMAVQDSPEEERSLSELFRIVALQYVDADGAASLLEEMKTANLARLKTELMDKRGDMAEAKAERLVKAGDEWRDEITKMVEARTRANRLKLQLEYYRILERQQDRGYWLEKSERKMGRSVT